MSHVWYFAYGSNMHAETFRGRRGIEARRAVGARLDGWRLVVDKPPLVPVGEAFANLRQDAAATTFGVAYEITADELSHVDFTEGVLIGNYERIAVQVTPLDGAAAEPIPAFTLVSDRRIDGLLPSRRYMACLVAGAEEHGLPAEWVAWLRQLPAAEETEEARRFRPLLDEVMRRRRPPRG